MRHSATPAVPSAGRRSRARWSRAGHVAEYERGVRPLGSATIGPAFVPRSGLAAGGRDRHHSSRRRPGVAGASRPHRDRRADPGALAIAGLDALEVYHSDHDAAAIERYHRMASTSSVC